ncbi:MAG: galactokinase family protein, partial [Patescibacteria group bacterium]|nr:galactokinase family protein [Patescibacteria group bacterium]
MSLRCSRSMAASEAFTGRLREEGMTAPAADAKCDLFRQALAALPADAVEDGQPYMLFVPGRIEVLGKHTDYAGGRSLLAAVERGFCVAAIPRGDGRVTVIDAKQGRRVNFTLDANLVGTPGDWSAYPMTVARRVARNFPGRLRGADIAFLSDLPPASGMSSSSAMMIAVFKVLEHVNSLLARPEARGVIRGPEDLAGYLATIENGRSFGTLTGDRGVGTFGGSEDHTAICCCRAAHLQQYSFCPTRRERVLSMPPGFCFAVAYCGVLAEKTGAAMGKYNRASQLV